MTRIGWLRSWAVLILLTSLSAYSSDFYEWTDENGVTHFAASPDEIPAKYREKAKSPKPIPARTATVSRGTTAGSQAVSEDPPPLRKFEVPYEASEGSARRVIIPVTMNDAVTVPMALDTGSPGMVVSVELAQRLGVLSKDNGKLLVGASGIGGTAPAILTIIDTVSVDGARSTFVPTTVTTSLSQAFQGLIGMDFLSGYTVSIDTKRKVVVFQENPSSRDAPGGHDEDWWRKIFEEFRSTRDRWRQYVDVHASDMGTRKAIADFQLRESERLLQRLNIYASDNAVPQHWR